MARRALRVVLVVVGIILVLGAVLVLFRDRIATWGIRRELATLEGYRGTLGRARVSLAGPTVTLDNLVLYDRALPGSREPAIVVPTLRADLGWGSLLRRQPVVSVLIDRPRILVQPTPRAAPSPPISERLRQSSPLVVRTLTVRGGTLVARSGAEREVRLERMDVDLHDIATRAALAGGKPVTGRVRGSLQGSGNLDLTLAADALQAPLRARVAGAVRGLRVSDVVAIAASAPPGLVPRGSISAAVDLTLANDRLTGTLTPGVAALQAPPALQGLASALGAAASSGLAGGVGERLGAVARKANPVLQGRATGNVTVPIDVRITGGPGQTREVVGAIARQLLAVLARAGIERFAPPQSRSSLEELRKRAEDLLPGFGEPQGKPGESKSPVDELRRGAERLLPGLGKPKGPPAQPRGGAAPGG